MRWRICCEEDLLLTGLLGHASQIADFAEAMRSGRQHHAWLLAGPQGVGKGLFATQAATRILANAAGPAIDLPGIDVPAHHRIAHFIEQGSHPDFRRIERLTKDKSDDLARSISVDQIRSLQTLFGSTPGFSDRRVVIIDSIDDLERAGANALLKNLEEPPAGTIFFLVSHAPGRLLPTIRSRCRLLRFGRLSDDVMTSILYRELPELSSEERDALLRVGEGAPGRALRFAGLDLARMDMAMDRLIRDGDPTNAVRMALARELTGKAAQARYEAFLERVPARIAAQSQLLSGPALEAAISLWEQARALADGAIRLSLDPHTTIFELATMLVRLAPSHSGAKA